MLPRSALRKLGLVLLTGVVAALASAQEIDFTDFSIEELSDFQISSLGRKRAAVFSTPGAASIITRDEILRSGAVDLAAAIRLAPGLQVARSSSSGYAVAARGFNDFTSSKLLVLMDGRSIYSHLSGGVRWGYQTVMFEDVARIEVLRGPAASLWGANAVNGVINVVSKSAHETLGSYASIAFGDELETEASLRQGVRLNAASAIRVYGSYQQNGGYGTTLGRGSRGWNNRLLGARYDWERRAGGGFTLISEYRAIALKSDSLLPSVLPPYAAVIPENQKMNGGNALARWVQPLGNDSELRMQGSFERLNGDILLGGERRDTMDLDIQITAHPLPRHDILGGMTYRYSTDEVTSSYWAKFQTPSASLRYYGAFIQDEISLIPQKLSVTIGAKIERNSYTGWEPQPSLRGLWHPGPNHALWAGISRAARIPSRFEQGVKYFTHTLPPTSTMPLPTAVYALGSSDFDSENLTAYEAGHRFKIGSGLSVDSAVFYNAYTHLRGFRSQPGAVSHEVVPHWEHHLVVANNLRGHTYGGEISLRWAPALLWDLDASVASVRTHLKESNPGPIPDLSLEGLEGNSPREEFKLRGGLVLPRGWRLDLTARHTGRLAFRHVEAYTGLDLRIAWSPGPKWTFEVVGRDLLTAQHAEVVDNYFETEAQKIDRNVFVRVAFRH